MSGASEIKSIEIGPVPLGNERSSVDFPYTDLDAAVELVRGVHNAGGTACDADQLAAQINMEAKGGGFRLRIGGAKSFGLITYERGGRVTLTDLGRQVIDPILERSARMNAFLAVELYQKVFDQFKGGPLPPQAGLERALVALGVGAGVKDRARQVLLRSAKQAGFFEHAADRLVKPSIRLESATSTKDDSRPEMALDLRQSNSTGGGGGAGGGGRLHPLIQGLLLTLPEPGQEWPGQARIDWLTMASSIFRMIYPEQTPSKILITFDGGANSAT